MPSDVPRSGANYQFPGGPAWGRNRGTFPFEGKDKSPLQISAWAVGSQVISGDRAPTKSIHKGSTSSVGMLVSCSNQKGTTENSSQQ